MKILDGQTLRDMTADEIAVHENNLIAIESAQQIEIDKEAARQSGLAKLAELGLTDAEIKALVG